jgi:TusA-related sulfurtransferase
MKLKGWIARDELHRLYLSFSAEKPIELWQVREGIEMSYKLFPEVKPGECIEVWITDKEATTKLRELFDKFYAWLDELPIEEYDKMCLTDKCEKFFFKIINQEEKKC